ncbi:unnamed protein product [Fraxinus pennsylvanica]|uniref:GHMP kinase C-terminal domain-containing protein n=1 Tax=Fraxinus pennsylvanica TaxID=56036 RepID=A0AAD1Z6B7_9LAMI|nr:unnamed protein product [Fraxinus pennsylvanica]
MVDINWSTESRKDYDSAGRARSCSEISTQELEMEAPGASNDSSSNMSNNEENKNDQLLLAAQERYGSTIVIEQFLKFNPSSFDGLCQICKPHEPGKVHSTVRQMWLDGDEFLISSMEEVAKIALQGQKALLDKDCAKFASLMNLLRQMFGDDALGALNIEMVEVAGGIGAASKFTGSGGAVIVFCPEGPSQVQLLEAACEKAGFVIEPVKVMPSLLKEFDGNLSSK